MITEGDISEKNAPSLRRLTSLEIKHSWITIIQGPPLQWEIAEEQIPVYRVPLALFLRRSRRRPSVRLPLMMTCQSQISLAMREWVGMRRPAAALRRGAAAVDHVPVPGGPVLSAPPRPVCVGGACAARAVRRISSLNKETARCGNDNEGWIHAARGGLSGPRYFRGGIAYERTDCELHTY